MESVIISVLDQYPVKRAALFGSAARGDMDEDSDVDMLVEMMPNTPGLEFFGLNMDLEEALGCSVDLFTYNTLARAKPSFRENVEREARIIYDR
ncbi:MAG: nucleotidyltransferase family protein [Clostridiales bacterium]|jgi:predicted nucleotidyltransferase|nr:nucleotidyltransferase family protein [Clostridiales bacterium]